MFERYTDKARRTIFFARYEAVQYGSPYIETEHLLLGLVREAKNLFSGSLPRVNYQAVYERIDARTPARAPASANVDLPLSNESRRVITYAAEEADRLADRHIGTEHLLLGLLREEKCSAAHILCELGADLATLREVIAKIPAPWSISHTYHVPAKSARAAGQQTVEIHGSQWNTEYVHNAVKECTRFSWHWQRQAWTPRDIVVNPADGRFSFELKLAEPPTNFRLVKAGWDRDHCFVCRWVLTTSAEAEHNTGYTNGREWLCTECYEKFIARPGFFSSNYPEIT